MNAERMAFKFGPLEVIPLQRGNESPQKSIDAIFLNGKNRKAINRVCEAYYHIIDGSGSFTVWHKDIPEIKHVHPGDRIIVSSGIPYRDEGIMVMIATYYPAFDINQVEFLE